MTTKPLPLKSSTPITWCPGCPNYLILEAVKRAIESLKRQGYKQNDFCMSTDIGCNSKIFDYMNISGVYGLHGRAVATAMGMKLGNPNLKVLAFQGDGGAYSEGMEHFIHAFRYNSDFTLIVHDNQSFSLTTGQTTPTTQVGEKSKSMPFGEVNIPLNPIKLALAAGATFVARCNPYDIDDTARIIEAAIKHKGFSYIEMMQKCLIFNTEMSGLDKLMYKFSDCHNLERAEKLANEWNYNSKTGKIPIGIIYQSQKGEKTLEEKWGR
ncbi:MAG: thiamine pyrophosphate-dependent enzyme [Candidatus Pacearchaeota archaeon]